MTNKTLKTTRVSDTLSRVEVQEWEPERYAAQYEENSKAFIPPPESEDADEWDTYLEESTPRQIAEPLATWLIGEFEHDEAVSVMFKLQSRFAKVGERWSGEDAARVRSEFQ